ncbi:hypothetical protein N0V95_002798 [Ascochyta clinopodiicola]|nr:hypothetical protein N0V95_002798 [Ascochyta clinopodiicola]
MPLLEDLRANQAPDDNHIKDTDDVSPALKEVQQAHSIFCRLWVIVNEVFLVYRDDKIGARSLAFALGKYHKLLELVATLPKSMVRADKTPHWVLIFHTVLHMVVLDLFRPYIAADEQHAFRAYVPQSSSPKTIFAASVMQLKGWSWNGQHMNLALTVMAGILFAFAIQYTPAYWNLALSGAMVFTVNAVLNDVGDKERHNFLAFCISMSQKLLPSYVYMIETIRAILAIATDKGAITTAEAIRIEAESVAMQPAKHVDRSKGGWVVAPTLNDNLAGDINTLTERFETITLFNEFTEGIA